MTGRNWYDKDTLSQGPVGEVTPEGRAHAVRQAAILAEDAEDLRRILDMLGLDPAEAVQRKAA